MNEAKRKNVISESERRIIRRKIRKMLLERRQRELQDQIIIQELDYMHKTMISEGYSIAEANVAVINEIDFGAMAGSLFGGGISAIKQRIVTSILDDMGIATNTLSGKFIVNLIENIGIRTISGLLGAGPEQCDAVTELLSKAAMETIVEEGAAKLISFVFRQVTGKTSTVAMAEIEKVMDQFITSIGIETANEILFEYLHKYVIADLAKSICTTEGGIMAKLKAGSAALTGKLSMMKKGGAVKGTPQQLSLPLPKVKQQLSLPLPKTK